VLDREFDGKLSNIKAVQEAEREQFARENRLTGIEGFIDAMQRRLQPGLWEERKAARQKKWDDLHARQKREREDYLTLFKAEKGLELEDLGDKHAQQLRKQKAHFEEERDRYRKDAEAAKRLRERLETERLELERGPEPPTRGK